MGAHHWRWEVVCLQICSYPDERGAAVGIYSFFPILGPAIGPLCGGFIEEYSSWRWAFWATTIADIPILAFGSVLLEETYGPLLLQRKKERLIKETGNHALHTRFEVPGQTIAMEMKVALTRPLILIGTQPIIMVMGLYQAYLYGLMYIVLTTYPPLWKTIYDQSVSIAGLNYISLGLGYCVGIQVRRSLRLCNQAWLIQRLDLRISPGQGVPTLQASQQRCWRPRISVSTHASSSYYLACWLFYLWLDSRE